MNQRQRNLIAYLHEQNVSHARSSSEQGACRLSAIINVDGLPFRLLTQSSYSGDAGNCCWFQSRKLIAQKVQRAETDRQTRMVRKLESLIVIFWPTTSV